MSDPNAGDIVRVEAAKGGGSGDRSLEMLAEGSLVTVFAGESHRSFTWQQWDALHKIGVGLLAGQQGRKAVEIAREGGSLPGLAADVYATMPDPGDLPPLDAVTDAGWANVARVLRELPGSWPLLRGLWEQAGRELEADRG